MIKNILRLLGLITLLLCCALTASIALASNGGGSGGSGGGCGGYTCPSFQWHMYGTDGAPNTASGTLSPAWKSFIAAASGTNFGGQNVSVGDITNQLQTEPSEDGGTQGIKDLCQRSGNVWAMMEHPVGNDHGVGGTVWDEADPPGKAAWPSVSSSYSEITTNLTDYGQPVDFNSTQKNWIQQWFTNNAGDTLVIFCSAVPSGQTPPVCPDKSATGVNQYIDKPSGTPIPNNIQNENSGQDSDAGAFCYSRDSTSTSPNSRSWKTKPGPTSMSTVEIPYSPIAGPTNSSTPDTHATGEAVTETVNTSPTAANWQPVECPTNETPEGNYCVLNTTWGTFISTLGSTCPSPQDESAAANATDAASSSVTFDLGKTDQDVEANGGIFDVTESRSYVGLVDNTTTEYAQYVPVTTTTPSTIYTFSQNTSITTTSYSFSLPASEWTKTGSGSSSSHLATKTEKDKDSITISDAPVVSYGSPTKPAEEKPTPIGCYPTTIIGSDPLPNHYQILTNHADPTGFTTASNYVGAGNIHQTIPQTDSYLSDALVTRNYSGPNSYVPLGGQSTASVITPGNPYEDYGLFNKLAVYPGGQVEGKYQDGQSNYTFFRDGNQHGIKIPYWTLGAEPGVSTDSKVGLQNTEVNVFDKSSPLPQSSGLPPLYPGNGYAVGDYLTVHANGADIFSSTAGMPAFYQWGGVTAGGYQLTSTVSNDNNGNSPDFTTSSIWASNSKQPVVLSGFQIYNPLLSINEPTTGIGFDGQGDPIYNVSTDAVNFDGVVFATHDSSNGATDQLKSYLEGSTGQQEFSNTQTPQDQIACIGESGCDFSTDGYTSNHSGYLQWNRPPTASNPMYTSVRFVRGTGE